VDVVEALQLKFFFRRLLLFHFEVRRQLVLELKGAFAFGLGSHISVFAQYLLLRRLLRKESLLEFSLGDVVGSVHKLPI